MKYLVFLPFSLLLFFSSCKKTEPVPVADELKYQTDFSVDDYTWFTDANHSVVLGSDGYYKMTQSQQNYQSWGIAPFNTINYNYSFSADGNLSRVYGNGYGRIGIVYNFIASDNYYAFYIDNTGTISVFKQYGKTFTTLLTAYSSAINTIDGQKNHIEVRQSGSTASFLVNSVAVGSCTSTRGNGLVSAGVALCTFSSPYFTPLTGSFDNVSIKKIP